MNTARGLHEQGSPLEAASSSAMATADAFAGAQPLGGSPDAHRVAFQPSTRYPDVAIEILDPSFAK